MLSVLGEKNACLKMQLSDYYAQINVLNLKIIILHYTLNKFTTPNWPFSQLDDESIIYDPHKPFHLVFPYQTMLL